MLSKAITWLKDWFGSSLLRRDTHRAAATEMVALTPRTDLKSWKLAVIARKRTHLKEQLEQAKRQKKARKHLYAALEALTREELRIEAGQ